MNKRLQARLALAGRRARHQDVHAANAKLHGVMGVTLIMLGLFGGALADWWIPPDTDAGIDPSGETELAWISDAPSPWITERVDLPPAPLPVEPGPRVCEQFGTCKPDTGVEQR
jgi:hypothetical protein